MDQTYGHIIFYKDIKSLQIYLIDLFGVPIVNIVPFFSYLCITKQASPRCCLSLYIIPMCVLLSAHWQGNIPFCGY